jgi:hypothetical protein
MSFVVHARLEKCPDNRAAFHDDAAWTWNNHAHSQYAAYAFPASMFNRSFMGK